VACGSSEQRGLRQEEWATIGGYQKDVTDMETQVSALFTPIPSPAPARLQDDEVRIFSPDQDATTSCVVAETDIAENRPDECQPGLGDDEAAVFDDPIDTTTFSLAAADGSPKVRLPAPLPASPVP
jgi:hypothetical protein